MEQQRDDAGEITSFLARWSLGEREALEQILPLVYAQLRDIARAYLRRERADHTLQATALVNELYLKLVQQRRADLKDRGHFLTFCARLMRRILIDSARAALAERRGGSSEFVPLSDELHWIDAAGPDVLSLETALDELAILAPEKVRFIELRFFLGCSMEDTADILGVSRATAFREQKFCLAWLRDRLS